MAAATPTSTLDLLDLLKKSRIWSDEELDSRLASLGPVPEEPTQAAAFLIRHGLVTTFQARVLLTGKYRGFRLGAYVVRDQIGQGGMGAVFLAHHEALRRPVAIKVLTPPEKGAASKVNVERFLREARSAAALDHPNIVRIFDVAQLGAMHYLVMEYVEGQTLDQMVSVGGPVACGRAVEYILQAAAGLEHAYLKGFVHRDIKPANLILAKDGTLKILDMGLARSEDAGDQVTEVFDKGAVVGTADYVSPEQAMNAPDLDIRADIYSLGATFYTLVTGKPPFSGSTTQKLMQHQIKETPSLDSLDKTFPSGLAAVVSKMMRKRPADRYQTPGEVMAALGPWLSNTSHVVAALSRTGAGSGVGSSADLQRTLNDVVSGGTKRLDQILATANRQRRSRRAYVVGGVAAVALSLVALGGLATYALSGSADKPSAYVGQQQQQQQQPQQQQQQQQQQQPPTPATPSTRRPTPTPVLARNATVYSFDAAGLADFRETWRSAPGKNGSGFIDSVVTSTTGAGALPEGWARMNYKAGTTSEIAAGSAQGSKAIGLTTLDGEHTTMVFTPSFSAARPQLRLKIEYLLEGTEGSGQVLFARLAPLPQSDGRPVGELTATDGKWVTREFDFDAQGATEGRLEFHTYALPTGKMLWVKSLRVTEAGAAKVAEAAPRPGKTVVAFDAKTLTPFREQFRTAPKASDQGGRENTVLKSTGDGQNPEGWYHENYRDGSVGEIAVESVGGVKAFGLATLEGEKTTMLFTPSFESRLSGLTVKVEYRTESSTGEGYLKFRQMVPLLPAGGWDVGKLAATGGQWATLEFPLDAKAAQEGQLEFHVGNLELGKMLWIKSYTVSAASPDKPLAAAGPRSSVYTFDATKLATFREQFRTATNKAKARELVALGRSGEGKLPVGWRLENYKDDTVSEVAVDAIGGSKALGITTLEGFRSTMMLTPLIQTVAPNLTLKIEYLTEGTEGRALIRFVPCEPREGLPVSNLGELSATDGQWVTREFPLDAKTSTLCCLEFHTSTLALGQTLWIKSYTVTGGGERAASASASAALPAVATALFRSDFGALGPFREKARSTDGPNKTKTAKVIDRSGDGQFPADWQLLSWHPDTVHEVSVAELYGAQALTIRTVSGKPTTMLFSPRVEFPGRRARVRVEYALPGGSGRCLMRFRHLAPEFGDVWDVATLDRTEGAWQVAEFDLELRQATAGHLEFHTTELPVGEAIHIKSVTVYQSGN